MGLQGCAKALAAVSCCWVEPNTHGLHYAQYKVVEKKPLRQAEAPALLQAMLASGWDFAKEKGSELHLQKAESDVFFSSNWPDRTYVMAFLDERWRATHFSSVRY